MSEVVTFTVIQISPFRNRAVDKRNQKCFENYQENIHVKVFLMNRPDCRYLVLDFLKLSQIYLFEHSRITTFWFCTPSPFTEYGIKESRNLHFFILSISFEFSDWFWCFPVFCSNVPFTYLMKTLENLWYIAMRWDLAKEYGKALK